MANRVRLSAYLVASLLVLAPMLSAQQSRGRFEGPVVAEWLNDHRSMKLLKPFAFIDPGGRRWTVPESTVVDGASIPRPFWSLVSGPFEGPYRNASVVHDHYCVVRTASWQDVHRMFYHAMLAAGTNTPKAKIMYYGVYVGGPRWKEVHVTNHEPRAFPRPGDIDRKEVRPWTVSYDTTLTREHIRAIESSSLNIEQIEQLAAQAFRGQEPPDVIRIP